MAAAADGTASGSEKSTEARGARRVWATVGQEQTLLGASKPQMCYPDQYPSTSCADENSTAHSTYPRPSEDVPTSVHGAMQEYTPVSTELSASLDAASSSGATLNGIPSVGFSGWTCVRCLKTTFILRATTVTSRKIPTPSPRRRTIGYPMHERLVLAKLYLVILAVYHSRSGCYLGHRQQSRSLWLWYRDRDERVFILQSPTILSETLEMR